MVIDMSTLATVHEINAGDALVDAGLRWSDLLRQTLPLRLAPPTLNDYIDLSIGGTLSVGGVGAQSFRRGPQVDNVLELTVVTGRGELVTCSPTQNRQLFDAVRAGLGQFGVIVQARLRLVPAAAQNPLLQGDLRRPLDFPRRPAAGWSRTAASTPSRAS